MKYFITGGAGQLGYDLIKELKKRKQDDYLAPTIEELDITDLEALRKVVKWKSHNSKHRLEKSVRITPSQAKELRKIVEMMSKPLPDRIKFTKQRLKL